MWFCSLKYLGSLCDPVLFQGAATTLVPQWPLKLPFSTSGTCAEVVKENAIALGTEENPCLNL